MSFLHIRSFSNMSGKPNTNHNVEVLPNLAELCGSMVHMILNILKKKMLQVYKVYRVLRNSLERSKPGKPFWYWKYSTFGQEKHGLGVRTGYSELGFGILNKEFQCRNSILSKD